MSMDAPTRRQFLAGPAILLPAALPSASLAAPAVEDLASVAADLRRYVDLGIKQAGGEGDNACGAWLAAELEHAGFAVERQYFSVPYFDPGRCELSCGAARATVWPQPIVVPTPVGGVAGPIVRVDADGNAAAPLAGALALVDLPHGRWSTALAPRIRGPIDAAFAAGARAVIAVTNGPTGQVIALNTDGRRPLFTGPVALLAPDDAAPLLAAAARGEHAVLHLTGRGGRRPAFNLVGRLDRGLGRWLVVSTPRSGWFACAGERGGGIAAWLALLRWASQAVRDHDLAFICNSGHEYEYLGAEEMLATAVPRPEATAFWLHLGANLASRDWHEGLGQALPLPGADSQRYLAISPSHLTAARASFAGLAGLEAPYSSEALSAGELTNILRAGYAPAAGIFGLHRYHHVAGDDMSCLSAEQVARAIAACRQLVQNVLAPA